MPRLPVVAIVGKPNTGKSTLFNAVVGRRQAIENDVAGTTRDPVAAVVEAEIDYLLLDTGGIGGGSEDKDFENDTEAQSRLALSEADVILFTVSAVDELTRSDMNVVDALRKNRKRHVPVIIVVTKTDKKGAAIPEEITRTGMSDVIIETSAAHRRGVGELEDAVTEELKKLHFGKPTTEETAAEAMIPKIAIVGRPNVGKSSLVNALMSGAQRKVSSRIVSPIPGTTRDSSDTLVISEGKQFVFIDTAGLTKKGKQEGGIAGLAQMRSMAAIARSDVTLLMLDAADTIVEQDKRIANMAIEEGKALVILLNKVDLLKGDMLMEKVRVVRNELPFANFAPIHAASAVTREGLGSLFPILLAVHANRSRRIETKVLKEWFDGTVSGKIPGKMSKTKYLTQAEETPPLFVLFAKRPKDIRRSELKFLEHKLRDAFAFDGVPMRFTVKASGEGSKRAREKGE